MENVPFFISVVFGLTVLLTMLLFYKATNHSKITLGVLLAWIILQSIVGISGFYTVSNTTPPRFLLLVFPPVLFIVILFITKAGMGYVDSLNIKTLTLLHIIRIPVEIGLFLLFLHKAVPKIITFEGGNVDILSGLTAPFVYYFGFVKKRLGKSVIIAWNIICLAFLINVVARAILSAPFPFQKFAFDQPNIAILYFPFILLPGLIVPLVMFSHLVAIRRLVKNSGGKNTLL
jgi:hypothetical protein